MLNNYLAPPLGVNPPPQPKPSYYAVIPATVRYSKSIPPGAKLLFGELTALCSVEGYCWASTPYFSELYEVDRSTIKRWLSALAAGGFIRVEVNRAWPEQRRIYLVETVPNGRGVAQKQATGSAKTSDLSRKNGPQSITKNNTKSITETLNVVGGASPLPEPEGKGQAAPAVQSSMPASPSALGSWKEQEVQAVVAVTGDDGSRKRFKQLLDICESAFCVEVWDNALDALKHALGASTGRVERPGAYFQALLVSALNERGVAVPVGKPSERRSVRGVIAASLAVADLAGLEVQR